MMLSLTACDDPNSNIVVQIVCPRINEYDQKTQDRALAEYNALPPGSALRLFIGDYKQLRDQVRVCRGQSVDAPTKINKTETTAKVQPVTFRDRWFEGVKTYATVFR